MDDGRRERLHFNLAQLTKRPSSWIVVIAGGAGYVLFHMPAEQLQVVLEHLPIPAWSIAPLLSAIALVSQIWPRRDRVAPDEATPPAEPLELVGKDRSE